MKKAPIFPLILQIWVLTLVVFLWLQLWNSFNPSDISSPENIVKVNTENKNSEVFSSASSSGFWTIWVALSTRIGTNFSNTSVSGSPEESYYDEITFIWENTSEKRIIRSNLIQQNMIIIREYLNLSRTDIKWILSSSNNRKSTLEWFISQLEMRYINSTKSISSLENQKALLLSEITKIESGIEATKGSMEKNFSESNPDATLGDVDDYFALRARYTEAFTDIVFINQFLKQHAFLNNYNKGILDTLINNKEALINESYVVIPDSGGEYLRPLELLFEEADFKTNVREKSE